MWSCDRKSGHHGDSNKRVAKLTYKDVHQITSITWRRRQDVCKDQKNTYHTQNKF